MDRYIDPANDIDWDDDFVWVQRAPILTVLESFRGSVHVRHPAGCEMFISNEEAETEYFPIRGGAMLKPRYAPTKAHCLDSEAAVSLPDRTVRLAAGDALLNDEGGFRIVRSAVYDRDYLAVAYPGRRAKAEMPIAEPAEERRAQAR